MQVCLPSSAPVIASRRRTTANSANKSVSAVEECINVDSDKTINRASIWTGMKSSEQLALDQKATLNFLGLYIHDY